MSLDCFGIDVDDDEIRRWNLLAADESGFLETWNRNWQRPILGGALPELHKARLLEPISEEDMRVPLLMEFGCGAGFNAPMALQYTKAYVGVDISSLAVAMARYHFGSVHQARFRHSVFDREEILRLRGTVGGIFGINFFYHQPAERLRPMIAAAGELLSDGGWLLLDLLPEAGEPKRDSEAPDSWQGGAGWTGFCVAYEDIEGAIADAGFTDVRREQRFFKDWKWEPRRRHYVICRKGGVAQ